MLRKGIYLLLALILIILPVNEIYAESTYFIGLNSKGYLDIDSSNYGDNMRLLVEKGTQKYYYSLDNQSESIPLQLGNGNYTVKILENIKDKRYKVVSKKELSLNFFNKDGAFLSSAQPVYWDKTQKISNLAKAITQDEKSDREKIEKIYNYVIKNIEYDDDKMSNIKDNYVPDISQTLSSQEGICYDYSATFAGLLRSLDIPTKVVTGYKNDIDDYHAWNEVLIDGQWHIIDTTYDSVLQNSKVNVKMIKEAYEYEKLQEF